SVVTASRSRIGRLASALLTNQTIGTLRLVFAFISLLRATAFDAGHFIPAFAIFFTGIGGCADLRETGIPVFAVLIFRTAVHRARTIVAAEPFGTFIVLFAFRPFLGANALDASLQITAVFIRLTSSGIGTCPIE